MQDIRVRPKIRMDSVTPRPAPAPKPATPKPVAATPAPRPAGRPKRRIFRKIFLFIFVVVLLSGSYYFFAAWSMPKFVTVELKDGMSRMEVAKAIAESLGWNSDGAGLLASTYAQLQWATFNRELLDLMTRRNKWSEDETEVFAINSTTYLQPELDFMSSVYVPGTYTIESSANDVDISNLLVERIKAAAAEGVSSFIDERIADEDAKKIDQFVQRELDLLPDLITLPARDLITERKGNTTLLRFSTVYYNGGEGPIELRADPKTIDLRKDIEREVSQRVYREDGTYREKAVGRFLWHQEHLHYHYKDFIVYDLDAVDAPGAPDLSGVRVKSTYCLRDVSNVELEFDNRPADAAYKICGKRLQGVSVGWADTYFNTYPDQALDISDLPSGTYKISFTVNPSEFLEESRVDNNKSYTVFTYDKSSGKVKTLEEFPSNPPEVKHIYKDSPSQ